MQAVIVTDSQRTAWNNYIAGNDYAIAWQVMEWHDLLRKHHPVEFYPIAAMEGDRIAGVLPLYRVKTLGGKSKLISVPYAVAGGIVADSPEAEGHLLKKAIGLHEQMGTSEIAFKQYKRPLSEKLMTDDSYYNRELELSGGVAALWERISEDNRRQIAITEKAGLRVERGCSGIEEFYRLLLDHHQRRGVPCVAKAWIRDLTATGMYDIALLRKGKRPVAGTMMKTFKKTVSFPFTCVDGEPENGSVPVYRLYWDLMRSYAEEGFEILHSGRIPMNDQTDGYRLGWGGTKYGYYYQYFPSSVTQTEFKSHRNRKRKIFEAVYRKIPSVLAEAVGPYIVRQFP